MRRLRKLVGKIPGTWRLYTALRMVKWELGALFHGLRTGRLASRLFGSAAEGFGRQRARHADTEAEILAGAPYPADASVRIVPVAPAEAQERASVANMLNATGEGPRLYDWVAVDGGTAFVVAGDAGAPDFERLAVADPRAEARRLLDADARSRLHFGREYKLRGGRYLYQSVPVLGESGRRDTSRRWSRIVDALSDAGHGVEDRLVLDVGCNAGMMLAAALSDGATWGVGWDLPEIATLGRRVLGTLGFTRFDLVGAELSSEYRLQPDVPGHLTEALDGCVVFYLAIRHHVGFVADLGTLPWRALVYEGGEEEDAAGLEETLAPLRATCDFEIASATDYRDGEGRPRPLAILVRS